MTKRRNLLNLAFSVAFVGIMVGQAIYCYHRPTVSIDSFAYMSLIDSGQKSSFTHAAYICSQTISGPRAGCDVRDSSPYQEVAAYSSHDYAAFLRFYQGKPIYLWCGGILYRLFKLSLYSALRTLSAASYFAIAGISLIWLSRYVRYSAACVLATFMASLPDVLWLGKVLGPDALSTALFLTVVYFLLFSSAGYISKLLLLVLLSLVRADNVIFCALYGTALIYRLSPNAKILLPRVASLIGLLLAIQLLSGRLQHLLPFATLFRHTFLEWSPPSTYAAAHVSLREYISVLRGIGVRAAVLNLPLPLLFATIALLAAPHRPLRDLLLVSLLTTTVRFFMFPSMEPRFYTWLLILSVIALVGTVGDSLRNVGRSVSTGNSERLEA